MSDTTFNIRAEMVGKTWNYWEIQWGPCGHGVKTIEDGERLPDPPCPYCRLALLEKVAEAVVRRHKSLDDFGMASSKEETDALRAAGYLGGGE